MSLLKRQVFEIPMDDLTPVEENFMKQTRLDLSDLPETMEDCIMETKEICLTKMKPMGVYYSLPLEELKEEEAIFPEGFCIKGGIVPLILSTSFEVIFYAATLKGFSEAEEQCEDAMDQYFLDAWGTAFVEQAAKWLHDTFSKELEGQEVFLTNFWSPGQHNFPIDNQKTLFEILKPEEIGMELTPRFMMNPTKSISSIIGVMKEKDERNLFACDFCPRRDSCLSAYGGACAKEN
ncbi:MAG: hypothetical protein IJO79_00160 [Firmicutes bacterium]|nr:hypothetical protein [Bacillota bacterium]